MHHKTKIYQPQIFSFVRLYNIENSEAVSLGVFPVGRQPQGFIGGTKSSFLEALGDTAVDFDFGPPEIEQENVVATQQTQAAILTTTTINDSVGNISSQSGLILIKSGSSTMLKGKFGGGRKKLWRKM